MGMYINYTSKGATGASAKEKCDSILADGGVEITTPTEFGDNLVCVVDNGLFGAAGYAYNERELKCFLNPNDFRPKRWFVWEKVKEYAL